MPPSASAAPLVPPPKNDIDEVRWGLVSAAPQGLKIPLPEPKTWLNGESADGWFGGKHPITSSEVRAKTWNHRGPADRRGCEEDIPGVVGYARAKLNEIDRLSVKAPKGFDTEVVVGTKVPVEPPKAPSPPVPTSERVVIGVVLAVGVRGRRCFAYYYETRASGLGAEKNVGQRLALMVERSLQRVIVTSDLDPDIPRGPLAP